jgi:hypothetical protein
MVDGRRNPTLFGPTAGWALEKIVTNCDDKTESILASRCPMFLEN